MESDVSTRRDQARQVYFFACPVCFEPLIRNGPSGLNLSGISRSGFKCKRCNKLYSGKEMYLDLIVNAGLRVYTEVQPKNVEIFRNPVVSFFYVRGWRQNFNQTGFPGPHEEIAEITRILRTGGVSVGTWSHFSALRSGDSLDYAASPRDISYAGL